MTPQPKTVAIRTVTGAFPAIVPTFLRKLIEINRIEDYHRLAFRGAESLGKVFGIAISEGSGFYQYPNPPNYTRLSR